MKIGFLGMGVMGGPMSMNVVKKCGCEVLGYDVVPDHMKGFISAGVRLSKIPLKSTKTAISSCRFCRLIL